MVGHFQSKKMTKYDDKNDFDYGFLTKLQYDSSCDYEKITANTWDFIKAL